VNYYDFTTKTETKITSDYCQFIAEIDNILYFNSAENNYLTLYSYDVSNNTWTNVGKDKKITGQITNIRKVNGLLYFTAGTYEGTAQIFYGSFYYINAEGTVKEIARDIGDDRLNVVENYICYFGNDYNYYKYDTISGKSTKYSFSPNGDNGIEQFEIGDKTYKVNLKNSKKVTVYTYTSATDEKNIKEFSSFSFAQKSKYHYYSEIQEEGNYVLVNMLTCNSSYTVVSNTWYVFDSNGKLVTKFN
jgi:hypothetical protein